MYSRGKEEIEREKNSVVPPQIVEKTLGNEDLSEKAKAAEAVLKAISPLLESRQQQIDQAQAINKALFDTSNLLGQLVDAFSALRDKISDIETAKTKNADLEREVLNKLNKIL